LALAALALVVFGAYDSYPCMNVEVIGGNLDGVRSAGTGYVDRGIFGWDGSWI